jgi:hypothetical protein
MPDAVGESSPTALCASAIALSTDAYVDKLAKLIAVEHCKVLKTYLQVKDDDFISKPSLSASGRARPQHRELKLTGDGVLQQSPANICGKPQDGRPLSRKHASPSYYCASAMGFG